MKRSASPQNRSGPMSYYRHYVAQKNAGILFLLSVTATGCADSSVDTLSVDDFYDAIFSALCANLSACCGTTLSTDECIQQIRSSAGSITALQTEAVAAGRVEFRTRQAQECIDRIQ